MALAVAAVLGGSFVGSAQAHDRYQQRHARAYYAPAYYTYRAPVRYVVHQPVSYVVYRPRIEYIPYAPVRYYYPLPYRPTYWHHCECDCE